MTDNADSRYQPIPAAPPMDPNVRDDGPIPLSFPAILRNPGVSHRFAHLRSDERTAHEPGTPIRKNNRRNDNDGKRWIRRKENAQFAGNPFIVHAAKADYSLQPPQMKATFPEPLPAYLPRTAKVPDMIKPALEPRSANAGRFSLSIKGMRRDLRKAGYRAQVLVQDIELELMEWLQGGAFAAPDVTESSVINFPGRPIGRMNSIFEVSRTPLQLIWSVADDAFARYVAHCCARYHEVVSFSKEVSGHRLTYMLRPNVTRPDSLATLGLDTPPMTDLDSSSHFETDPESDVLSDVLAENAESDVENSLKQSLPAISEAESRPLTPDNDWSIVEGSDIEGDESGHEGDITIGVQSLSLQPRRPLPLHMSSPLRSRQDRSASSPSRSPARRTPRRLMMRRRIPTRRDPSLSFFDYLFS